MNYYVIYNKRRKYFDFFKDAFDFAFDNNCNVYSWSGVQLTEWLST